MDTQEYIDFLRENSQVYYDKNVKIHWLRIRKQQLDDYYDDSLDYNHILQENEESYKSSLDLFEREVFVPVRDALHNVISSDKIENVPIIVLPSKSLNGQVVKIPNNDQVIVIDLGLLSMIHTYVEVIYTSSLISSEYGPSESEKYLHQAYKFIIDYFSGDLSSGWFDKVARSKRELFQFISLQTSIIEVFIILHELAHIFSDHLSDSLTRNIIMFLGDEARIELEFYQKLQHQEFEADILAVEWLYKIFDKLPFLYPKRKTPEDNNTLVILSVCMFFGMIALVEKNLIEPDPYSTHPSAIDRIRNLASIIPEDNIELKSMYHIMTEMFACAPNLKYLEEKNFYSDIDTVSYISDNTFSSIFSGENPHISDFTILNQTAGEIIHHTLTAINKSDKHKSYIWKHLRQTQIMYKRIGRTKLAIFIDIMLQILEGADYRKLASKIPEEFMDLWKKAEPFLKLNSN